MYGIFNKCYINDHYPVNELIVSSTDKELLEKIVEEIKTRQNICSGKLETELLKTFDLGREYLNQMNKVEEMNTERYNILLHTEKNDPKRQSIKSRYNNELIKLKTLKEPAMKIVNEMIREKLESFGKISGELFTKLEYSFELSVEELPTI
jgi:hypothetical protein